MSKWYSFHIKNEILFWFIVLALIPLVALTTINYQYQKNIYEKQALEHLELIRNQQLENIDNYILLLNQEIKIFSNMPYIKSSFKLLNDDFVENNHQYLKEKKYDESFFHTISSVNKIYDLFLINKSGDVVYSIKKESDLGTNLLSGVYANTNLAKVFQVSLSLLETQISDFEFYLPSNEQAAFIATPLYDNGTIVGAIVVQINNKTIYDMFTAQDGLGITGEFYAAKMNAYNQVVSTTPLRNIKDSVNSNYQFSLDKHLPINRAVKGDKGSSILNDIDGNSIVAAWGYIPSLRWGTVVQIDLTEILEPIAQLRFYSIIILFFVGMGIVVGVIMAVKHIVKPIENLTNRVKNFSKEKFDSSDDIEVDNEIGDLSRNFSEMALSLKASQHTIQNYANELETKVNSRTQELEVAKEAIEKTNKNLQDYVSIIDRNVITSSTNPSGVITSVSEAFCKITGYSKEELIGKRHNIVRHPDMSEETYKELWETIISGNIWKGEIKNQRKDGTFYWVKSTITPIYEDDGNIKEYTSIREDITDKKLVEKLSITDQLTQLYNRVKLEEVFISELNRATRYKEKFAVILLDIDHFKRVNDTHGHDVGDETLKAVAMLLKNSTRETDIIGRWGGEEFLVVVPHTNLEDALEVAQKVRKAMEDFTFKVIGKKTASFGVSIFSDGDTQESLVKRADEALYVAKDSGRNCVKTVERR